MPRGRRNRAGDEYSSRRATPPVSRSSGIDILPHAITQLSDEALNLALSARRLALRGSRTQREKCLSSALSSLTGKDSSRGQATSEEDFSHAPPASHSTHGVPGEELTSTGFSAQQLNTLQRIVAFAVNTVTLPAPSSQRGHPSSPTSPTTRANASLDHAELALPETHARAGEPPRLCAHLSAPVLSKIQRGQFVDFSGFLPPWTSGQQEPSAKHVRVTTVRDADGSETLSLAAMSSH